MKKLTSLFLVIIFFALNVFAAVTVTVNGTTHTIPEKGERGWASNVTAWIQDISADTLQPTGGSFTLGADVDFGASYGLKSAYFSSRNANPASAGLFRLNNTDAVKWRNGANSADLTLGISSNWLQFEGVNLADISSAQTLTNKSIDADANTITNIENADIKAAAAIALDKLAATTIDRALVSDGSGFVSASSVTATELGYVSGVTSAIQTQIDNHLADTTTHGTTGAIVGTSDTQTLSNKTFSDAVTGAQISTPSNPSSGFNKLYFKSDDKLYKLDSAGNELEVGTGAGGGDINYFDGGDFESGTGLATVFDEGGATYTDGTGGSAGAITIEEESAAPLIGSKSLQINKAASDATGEGVTLLSEAINLSHRGRNLFVSFEWDGSTATSYTAGDLCLYAYSTGTDASTLPVVPLAGLDDDGCLPALKTKVVAYIPTTTNTDGAVRVSLFIPSDSETGGTFAVFVDDAKFSPGGVYPSAIITPWQSYSPTVGGVTGGSYTSTAYWRRVGSELEVTFDVVWGTIFTGGSNPTISLPSGLAIDSAELPYTASTLFELGQVQLFDSGVSTMRGRLVYNTTTNSVTIYATQTDQGTGTDQEHVQNLTTTVPFTWANNDRIMGSFKVPISGWEASAAVSTVDLGLQTSKARMYLNAASQSISSVNATTVQLETESYTEGSGLTVNTGSYRIDINRTGYYLINAKIRLSGVTAGDVVRLYILNSSGAISEDFNNGDALGVNGVVIKKLTAGDYVYIQADSTADASYSVNGGNSVSTYLEVIALPDFSVYGAYQEKNKVQTKILSADVTTATTMSDLTFSNLTVGKFYEYKFQGNFGTDTTDDEVFVTVTHNGSTLGSCGTDNGGAAVYNQVISTSGIFQAAASTLTFVSVSATANAVIYGNGTKGETWAQLIERNDLIETSAW